VLLLFITLDTGKAVFVKTSLQSAAAAAATIGARSGTIGDRTAYTESCPPATQSQATGQNQNDNLIFLSLCRSAPWESMGAEISEVTIALVAADNRVYDGSSRVCTKDYPYVRVRVKAKMQNMLVPGISRDGGFGLTVSSLLDSVEVESTVFCEVYREA